MSGYGLDDNYEYVQLFLDSRDATQSSDSRYSARDAPLYEFSVPIQSIAAIKILEVQIPFTYNLVTSSNQNFELQDDTVTATVTIPVGIYTPTTMPAVLKAALELVSANTYTVTYSSITDTPYTGRYTITNNAGGVNTFTLTFGSSTDLGHTNPRFLLGMNGGANTSSTSQTLVSPDFAMVNGPSYLYVNSRTFGPQLQTLIPAGALAFGESGIGPQICKVPVNTGPGGMIIWADADPQKWFTMANYGLLSRFDLYITVGNSANPSVVSLNGMPFSVKMGVLKNKFQTDTLQGVKGASETVKPNKRGRGF